MAPKRKATMNDFEFLLTAHTNVQTVKAEWYAQVKDAYGAEETPSYAETANTGYEKASAEADLVTVNLISAVQSVAEGLNRRVGDGNE